MNTEINRITWKCRRGMREIDLLLREFSNSSLHQINQDSLHIFDKVLDYDDQKLFDYIFKNESLGDKDHEDFIDKYLKKFKSQGNF
jgi:antitoxin CptB